MENNKSLNRMEGVKKIRQIIKNDPIGMMATNLVKIPFSVCPMTTQEVDENGNLWFFSAKDSDHYKDILQDNRIQILYSNTENGSYLSIYGTAVFLIDNKKLQELWNPKFNLWFTGWEDPNLSLTYVSTNQAFYWDSKIKKQISIFDRATGEKSVERFYDGEKGNVDLGDS